MARNTKLMTTLNQISGQSPVVYNRFMLSIINASIESNPDGTYSFAVFHNIDDSFEGEELCEYGETDSLKDAKTSVLKALERVYSTEI